MYIQSTFNYNLNALQKGPYIRKLTLIVIAFVILSFEGISQVEKFDIEYPYSDYIHFLHIDESTGYVWGVNEDNILLFGGKNLTFLPIEKYANGQRYELYKGAFLDNQYIYQLGAELVSIDFMTKELKTVWNIPESHVLKKVHRDKVDDSIWIFTEELATEIISVFKINNDATVSHKFDLPDPKIISVFKWESTFEESSNLFYFYGAYDGLFIFDKEGNEVPLMDQGKVISDSEEACYVYRLDNKGILWRIAFEQYERYNKNTKSFEIHPISGKFSTRADCENVKVNGRKITTILEDSKGRIWMGFEGSVLFYYDVLNDKLVPFRKEIVNALDGGGGEIKYLTEDKDGNIWGNKRGGLFKIREKDNYFKSYLVNTNDKTHPIYEEGNSTFINKVVSFYKERGIQNSKIHNISEDSNEDLFFQDGRFTYRLQKGSDRVEVLPFFTESINRHIYADKDIKLLAVYSSYFTFDSTLVLNRKSTPLKEINIVFRRGNGDLFVAGKLDKKHRGLFAKLNSETLEFEDNFKDPTGIIDFDLLRINSIDEDDEDNLWVGTDIGALKMHAQDGFKEQFSDSLKYQDQIIKLSIESLSVSFLSQDYVWIKSLKEIGLLNTKTREFKYYLHKSKFDIHDIYALLPIDDKSVWAGDYDGFFHYNFETKKLTRFYENEGLGKGAYVENITKLKDGRLAIGSANGLYIAHPDSLLAIKERTEDVEDGLAMKLSSYSYLDGKTDEEIRNDFVMDAPLDIQLNHNDKILKLEYFINNHNSFDRQAYSYMLEGFDKDWSSRSKSNIAYYASIPPGSYTFKARGAASGDNWSEQLLSIPITVHEAWYKTWWFFTLLALGLMFLIYSILYSYFNGKLKKRELIERLRNRISSDLHDDVGSLLSSLAWQTDMISLTADEEMKQKFSKISGLSRSAMERMRDTVWAIDSNKDNTLSLVERMLDFLADHFEDRETSFTFSHDDFSDRSPILPDVRQNVYLIFKEAVTNALKYSKGDLVAVKLFKKNDQLHLTIKDNGGNVGQSSIKKSGLGLSNMSMRAKRINAQLVINWEGGCSIELVV